MWNIKTTWIFQGWLLVFSFCPVHCSNMETQTQTEADRMASRPTSDEDWQQVYGPPALSDEEKNTVFMPPVYRCDACAAVAYRFDKGFAEEEKRRSKKGQPLTESQILDVSDRICTTGFSNFGIKSFQEKNRLSGPGLRVYYEPGVATGGNSWRDRLRVVCKELVGLHEEDGLYEMYRTKRFRHLATLMCPSYCSKKRWSG